MQEARLAKDHAPIKAGVSAQLAVAVAILSFAPIRLGNLVGIELEHNLIKPGGLNTPYEPRPFKLSVRSAADRPHR